MKKYLCLLVIMALSLFSATGCNEVTDWEPTEYDNVNNVDGVLMTVKEESVSPTSLTVVLKNNSDIEYEYGSDFLLEKNQE